MLPKPSLTLVMRLLPPSASNRDGVVDSGAVLMLFQAMASNCQDVGKKLV
jgi:hypothetical protein